MANAMVNMYLVRLRTAYFGQRCWSWYEESNRLYEESKINNTAQEQKQTNEYCMCTNQRDKIISKAAVGDGKRESSVATCMLSPIKIREHDTKPAMIPNHVSDKRHFRPTLTPVALNQAHRAHFYVRDSRIGSGGHVITNSKHNITIARRAPIARTNHPCENEITNQPTESGQPRTKEPTNECLFADRFSAGRHIHSEDETVRAWCSGTTN